MLRKVSDKAAYIIVIALCCAMIISYSGFANGNGSFYNFYVSKFNISNSAFQIAGSVIGILTSIWIARATKYIYKFNTRLLMIVANIIGLLSGCLTPVVNNVFLYIALMLIRNFITFCFNSVIVTIVVVNWFKEKTATVISTVMISSGVGGIIISKIYSYTIEAYGNIFSVSLYYFLVFLTMIPVSLLLPLRPEDVGKKPYFTGKEIKKEFLNCNLDYKDGSRIFWLIAFTCGSVICLTNINVFLPSLYAFKGFSSEECALTTTYVMIGNVLSKCIFLLLIDKFGVKKMSAIMLGIGAIGLGLLLFVPTESHNLKHVFLIMYGCSHAVSAIGISMFVKSIYAVEYFGEAYSKIALCDSIVNYAINIVVSFIYDEFGLYDISFMIAVVFGIIAIISINVIMKRLQDDIPEGMKV